MNNLKNNKEWNSIEYKNEKYCKVNENFVIKKIIFFLFKKYNLY